MLGNQGKSMHGLSGSSQSKIKGISAEDRCILVAEPGASKTPASKRCSQKRCRGAGTATRTCSVLPCPDPANLIATDTTDLAVLRCHQSSHRSHHCIRIASQTPLSDRSATAPEESRVQPSSLSRRRPCQRSPGRRRAKVRIAPARLPGALPGGFCSSCSPRLRLPTASGDGQGTTAPTGPPGPPAPGSRIVCRRPRAGARSRRWRCLGNRGGGEPGDLS